MKDNNKGGFIYIVRCYVNGKMYVGQTTYDDYKKRIHNHFRRAASGSNKSPKFYNAIRKHGREKFYHGVVCECSTREELDRTEDEMITRFQTIEHGYNLMRGGISCKHSEEHVRKISAALKGRPLSEKNRTALKGVKKTLTDQQRAIIRERSRLLGLASKGQKRRPISEEHRKKLSLSLLNAYVTGDKKATKMRQTNVNCYVVFDTETHREFMMPDIRDFEMITNGEFKHRSIMHYIQIRRSSIIKYKKWIVKRIYIRNQRDAA